MRKLFCLLSAVAALAGCATFGVNTAPPEPAVPRFITDAFPWEFSSSPYSRSEVAETRLVCREYPAGACIMKFDQRVGSGYAQVLYYPDWDAHVAVSAQPYRYNDSFNYPVGVISQLRVALIEQGMLVTPVEKSLNGVSTAISYTGIRAGKRVRGKVIAFYSPYPGMFGRSQLNILYGEWLESGNAPMAATFTRLAVAMGYPQGLD